MMGLGGALSGTPTAQGTYNFTVSLADTCTTDSKAFTLNVVDSCFATGIYNYNATGVARYYKILALGAVCTTAATCNTWANAGNLTIQPNQTYCFYRLSGCAAIRACTGTPSMTYTSGQTLDANENCLVQFTSVAGTVCNFGDR